VSIVGIGHGYSLSKFEKINKMYYIIVMNLQMNALIQVIAQALDMVEISFLGASTNHGKRIAVLCAAMGRHINMEEAEISELSSCALLHDNALSEYMLLMQGREEESPDFKEHCIIGQRNLEYLPFKGNINGFILYHHERADGDGLFGMKEGDCPVAAEFIAATDMLDTGWHLQCISIQELPALRKSIEDDIHHRFTARAGNALLAVLDEDMLESLKDERITETAFNSIPAWAIEMDNPALVSIADFIAHIIDCRSTFTKIHTQQIANRSWLMADYYGYDLAGKIQLYLAAALHDIGKLAIPIEVLEKPGKLDDEEFKIIKTHIDHTASLLKATDCLGPIAGWASNHHEKLDGSGYPQGKTAAELDCNSRLLVSLDIYQAVSEERPYHPQRSHDETMKILFKMTEAGTLDPQIVKDIDKVMAEWSGKLLKPPKYRD
jgi:HD-GYP domain-containing protein (c-di-GMP phosphodiesterase class II)